MKKPSFFREFLRYMLPNVLGMVGLSCYILADTFFVARRLGPQGLAALNLAIPVYSLVHGCALMLGMGGATRFAIAHSRGNSSEAGSVFAHTLLGGVALSLVFVLCGVFLSGQIASLLGAQGDVYEMTQTYLRVDLFFAPAFIFNEIMVCFVRNDKAPRLSMAAMLSSSLSNIILDYVFLFPCNMGIFGAVLATGLAPLFSMGVMSFHLIKSSALRPVWKGFRLRLLGGILSLGVPSLVTEASLGVVMVAFNSILLSLSGNIGVAAYGVVANLALVVSAVYTGIGQGLQPLASRAYGAGDKTKAARVYHYALLSAMVFSAAVYALLFCFAGPVASVFNTGGDAQMQSIAVKGLRLYFISCPFLAFNLVLSAYLASVQQALPAQIISLCRGLLVILPVLFLLAALFGLTGVWLAVPAAEALVAAAAFIWKSTRKTGFLSKNERKDVKCSEK